MQSGSAVGEFDLPGVQHPTLQPMVQAWPVLVRALGFWGAVQEYYSSVRLHLRCSLPAGQPPVGGVSSLPLFVDKRMLYTSLAGTFILRPIELEDSPSRRDGVSEEAEGQLRLYGCEIIQEGGCLLKLPQVVMATGQVLFHRFFCKQSMVKFNVKVCRPQTIG